MVCLGLKPGWQDGRHTRIHQDMAAPPTLVLSF